MYQAIVTRYFGPSGFRNGRIRASAAAGFIYNEWDSDKSADQNHMDAAKKLADRFKWSGQWVYGGMPDCHGKVFVMTGKNGTVEIAFTTTGEN